MTIKLTVSHRAKKPALLFWGLFVIGLIPVKTLAQAPPADLTKLSIEELMNITIESVSKFEQRAVEAPASISIIISYDIKKYGYRNLPDILRSVPGLFATYA